MDVTAKIGLFTSVALRKESVDRNLYYGDNLTYADGSLSARRAWIEIIDYIIDYATDAMSLSARRAWIEMDWASVISAMTSRRSPQGERG